MNCRHCKTPFPADAQRLRTSEGRELHACEVCLEFSPAQPPPPPHRPTVRRQNKYGGK